MTPSTPSPRSVPPSAPSAPAAPSAPRVVSSAPSAPRPVAPGTAAAGNRGPGLPPRPPVVAATPAPANDDRDVIVINKALTTMFRFTVGAIFSASADGASVRVDSALPSEQYTGEKALISGETVICGSLVRVMGPLNHDAGRILTFRTESGLPEFQGELANPIALPIGKSMLLLLHEAGSENAAYPVVLTDESVRKQVEFKLAREVQPKA
jgi:hypothetical protein